MKMRRKKKKKKKKNTEKEKKPTNEQTNKQALTASTCHTMTVVSLDPVASLVPSLENLQNQTSLQCSVSICWV